MILVTQRLHFKTAEQTFQSRARFGLFLLYSLAGHFALCLGLRGIMGVGELSEKPKKKLGIGILLISFSLIGISSCEVDIFAQVLALLTRNDYSLRVAIVILLMYYSFGIIGIECFSGLKLKDCCV